MRPDRSLFPRSLRSLRSPVLLGLALAMVPLAACRNNMHNQNKVRPLRESTFYPDGASARPLPAHTVPTGPVEDEAFYSGVHDRQPVAAVPFPVTRDVLLRGEQRFNIFCSPCHGRLGDGNGMIVTRGYKQPTSFHDDRLRNAQVGYFFNVMTQGFGIMPSYASQIPAADRWSIAAYIRVLQLSQNARLADLPPAAQKAVENDLAQPPAAQPAPQQPSQPLPSSQPPAQKPNEVP